MRLRIFIIEPSEPLRHMIVEHVNALGHEAVPVQSAEMCRFDQANTACNCRDQVCGDAIIFGQDVPLASGLEFVERRLHGGCKGPAANNAIIFRPLSLKIQSLAEEVGCHYLEAKVLLDNTSAWLKEVAERIPSERLLMSLAEVEGDVPVDGRSTP